MSATAPDPGPDGAWPGPSAPPPDSQTTGEPSPGAEVASPSPGVVQPAPAASGAGQPDLEVRRTRTGTAYVASIVGIIVTALVIVFIVQNLHDAKVHFVTLTFSLPVGVIILGAAVAGALIVVLVSLARILQLRMAARRHRRAHRQPARSRQPARPGQPA